MSTARNKPSSNPARSAGEGKTNAQFAPIVEAFHGDARVAQAHMFGSSALKVNGKVFAMLRKGGLVVKLPAERIEALIGAHLAERFDPGHGRLMKEWAAIKPKAKEQWLKLAKEARQFVASGK